MAFNFQPSGEDAIVQFGVSIAESGGCGPSFGNLEVSFWHRAIGTADWREFRGKVRKAPTADGRFRLFLQDGTREVEFPTAGFEYAQFVRHGAAATSAFCVTHVSRAGTPAECDSPPARFSTESSRGTPEPEASQLTARALSSLSQQPLNRVPSSTSSDFGSVQSQHEEVLRLMRQEKQDLEERLNRGGSELADRISRGGEHLMAQSRAQSEDLARFRDSTTSEFRAASAALSEQHAQSQQQLAGQVDVGVRQASEVLATQVEVHANKTAENLRQQLRAESAESVAATRRELSSQVSGEVTVQVTAQVQQAK